MARIDAIRQISIAEQTYYRWRQHYGGMGKGQLQELKRLQKENERLRRAVSDLTLDKLILAQEGVCWGAESNEFWNPAFIVYEPLQRMLNDR